MSVPLAEALATVDLEEGKTYRCEVKGRLVVLQVLPATKVPLPAPLVEADIMLEPWVALPPPRGGVRIRTKPGKVPLPDPPDISLPTRRVAEGMLDLVIDLPYPEPAGTVIAQRGELDPPDLPEIA